MADCNRGEIPEEIIRDKGLFHCKRFHKPPYQDSYPCFGLPESVEYVPSDADVISDSRIRYDPYTSKCLSIGGLARAMGNTLNLRNVVYEDDYMSWESDEITVENAPVETATIYTILTGSQACNGKHVRVMWDYTVDPPELKLYSLDTPVTVCGGLSTVDTNPLTGGVVNYGWYGTTLQFYLNIYKIYCCVKDENDEVIDYDYAYYYVAMHKRDGVLCIDSYGELVCVTCFPTFDDHVNPDVTAPYIVIQVSESPNNSLIYQHYIPMKIKEENDL